ncbi:ABC transporter permease subunit [Paenibacillus polygoni]|uniref:ABC transporter permease subunit n=1 Tax=Paenibacillus polygoni TaxID=3050112 RepID=A0ABY8X219_9BACL|nr:ABC transporter permease [Paenibacillus polygoni]WIV18526.1 ABC transporter permease subunit [Paenibacillus polygoni]
MKRMMAIFYKELQSYFLVPTTYFAFAVYVLLSSFLFFMSFVYYQPSIVDYRLVLGDTVSLLIYIVPLLTMRLIAEEFKQGTDELLMTSPTSVTEIVFGKYLASLVILLLLILCSLTYPLIMSLYGDINETTVWLSALGLFLMGASMMAIGLFASSLTQHQMVSAVAGFIILLVLWMIDSFTDSSSAVTAWLSPFSLSNRFANFTKGVISGPDVIFYLTLAGVFLTLSIQGIERKRWR